MNIFYVIFMFIMYWYFEIYKDKAVSLFEIPKKQDPPTSQHTKHRFVKNEDWGWVAIQKNEPLKVLTTFDITRDV